MLTTDRSLVVETHNLLVARRTVLGAGLALAVTAFTGCGGSSPTNLDTYWPSDRAFFEPLRLEGAIRYGGGAQNLEGLVKGSLAVVQSKISNVVVSALSSEKEGASTLTTFGLVLPEPELLKGRLPDSAKVGLTVVGGTTSELVDEKLSEMREILPKGEAIWFLNSIALLAEERKAKLKELGQEPTAEDQRETTALGSLFVAGPHSVVIQGSTGLDMPYLTEDDYMFKDALGDDLRKLKSMSQLRAAILAVR